MQKREHPCAAQAKAARAAARRPRAARAHSVLLLCVARGAWRVATADGFDLFTHMDTRLVANDTHSPGTLTLDDRSRAERTGAYFFVRCGVQRSHLAPSGLLS